MKRDTLTLVIVLVVATGLAVLLRNYRRSHTTPSLRTESVQDESFHGGATNILAHWSSNGVTAPNGLIYSDGKTLVSSFGLYIEDGDNVANATNPNDYVVKWSLPNGTWTATWKKN